MAGMENYLHKLKGIGPKHTEMLEKIGVDSIKVLSHRNAASLKVMIEERHGAVIGVSESQIQGWIDEGGAANDHLPAGAPDGRLGPRAPTD